MPPRLRVLIVGAALLLAAALLWMLTRPEERPPMGTAASVAPPAEVAATLGPLSAPERSAVPTAEDKAREFFASLPGAALTVRILDPYEVLTAPCRLRVETRLPDSRRIGVTRPVDPRGECRFARVPAGKAWLTLLRAPAEGGEELAIFEQTLELVAGDDREHVMNLHQQVIVVDLECSTLPVEVVKTIRLSAVGTRFAEWSGIRLASPPLRVWIPVNTTLSAWLAADGTDFTTSRLFAESGWQTWRIELPTGALHVSWLSTPEVRRFRLTADPARQAGRNWFSDRDEKGCYSFYLLPPGRYFLQAIMEPQGIVAYRAASMVEIGSEPVYLDLQLQPAGTLNFAWPAPPEPVLADQRLVASVYPRGVGWPIFASRAFALTDEWRFDNLAVGDYDLVVTQASWSSRTPVTVYATPGAPVSLREWRRQVDLYVVVTAAGGAAEPEEVRLIDADEAARHLRYEVIQLGFDDRSWTYRSTAPPGPARLLVRAADGKLAEFDFVVADQKSVQHRFRLPD